MMEVSPAVKSAFAGLQSPTASMSASMLSSNVSNDLLDSGSNGSARTQIYNASFMQPNLQLDFSLSQPTGWLSERSALMQNGLRLEMYTLVRALHGMNELSKAASLTDEHVENFFKWFADFALIYQAHLEWEETIVVPLFRARMAALNPAYGELPSEERHVKLSLRLNRVKAVKALFGTSPLRKVVRELTTHTAAFLPLALSTSRDKEAFEYPLMETVGNPTKDLKALDKAMLVWWSKNVGVYKCCTLVMSICENWMSAEERDEADRLAKTKITHRLMLKRAHAVDRKRRELVRPLLRQANLATRAAQHEEALKKVSAGSLPS